MKARGWKVYYENSKQKNSYILSDKTLEQEPLLELKKDNWIIIREANTLGRYNNLTFAYSLEHSFKTYKAKRSLQIHNYTERD